MAGGKHILGRSKNRVFGTAKVGDRGQIVIPQEARRFFGISPKSGSPANAAVPPRNVRRDTSILVSVFVIAIKTGQGSGNNWQASESWRARS